MSNSLGLILAKSVHLAIIVVEASASRTSRSVIWAPLGSSSFDRLQSGGDPVNQAMIRARWRSVISGHQIPRSNLFDTNSQFSRKKSRKRLNFITVTHLKSLFKILPLKRPQKIAEAIKAVVFFRKKTLVVVCAAIF